MMITFTQIALIAFLILNLVVALYSRIPNPTMDEYVKANKNLSHGTLIATLVATLLDAGNVGLKIGFVRGLISLVYPFSLAFTGIVLGLYVFPKMTQFTNEYTIAELMNTFFGSFARYFTAIFSSLFSILIIIAQLVAWGNLGPLLGIAPAYMILGMGVTVTIYTFIGGIRAVTKTDILQMLVIVVCIIGFFLIVFFSFGGIQNILAAVPKNSNYFAIITHTSFRKYLVPAFFWSIFPTFLISPPIIHRLLMAKAKRDIKNMFLSFGLFYMIFRILMIIVSFSLFSVVTSTFSIKAISLGETIKMICASYVGRLLFILAICAIVMSTVDSFLNSIAILLVNDIAQPLSQSSNQDQIKKTRITALLVGLVCTGLALIAKRILILDLMGYGFILFSSITIPFLLALLGMQGSQKSFLVHIITFFSTILLTFGLMQAPSSLIRGLIINIVNFIGNGVLQTNSPYIGNKLPVLQVLWLIAIVTSTLAFLVTHYIENKGFVLVAREKNLWILRSKYKLHSFFKWLLTPITWANEKVAKVGDRAYVFSLLVICYFMLPYWGSPATTSFNYYGLYLLRIIAVVVAFGTLAGKKVWPNKLKPYFNLYYQKAIFFCLSFIIILTAMADFNNKLTPFHLTFGITALSAFVDWNTFLLFQSISFSLACLILKLVTGYVWMPIESTQLVPLVAAIGLGLSIALVFIRYNRNLYLGQRAKNNLLEEEKQNLLVSMTDSQEQLAAMVQKDSITMKTVQKRINQLRLEFGESNKINDIDSAMKHFYQKSEDAKRHLRMHLKEMTVEELLDYAWVDLKNKDIDPSDYHVQLTMNAQSTTIVGDLYYLKNLLVNATHYSITHTPNSPLNMIIDNVTIQYDLPDIYKNEPKQAVRMIITNDQKQFFSAQVYHPYEKNKELERSIPSALKNNIRIIKAHFGFLDLIQSKDTFTQVYILPLNLKAIRPKIQYFVYEDLFDEVKIDMPEEQAFLQEAEKKGMKIPPIKLAMQVAKHYHFEQKRKSGEPYYLHPLAVARQLLNYTDDEAIIIAALLHDTIEDTPYEVNQMQAMFGERVRKMVEEVTHLYSKDERPKMRLGKQETLDLLIKNGNRNSLLIKLVDRLHNMQTIASHPDPEKRKKIAKETLLIFIPIAQKLEIPAIEQELKKLINSVLNT